MSVNLIYEFGDMPAGTARGCARAARFAQRVLGCDGFLVFLSPPRAARETKRIQEWTD